MSKANARHSRSWGEEWLEPVADDFQELHAAETLEVQEVIVEEEDVATVTLVEGKADNLAVEATSWAVRMSGYFFSYNSK